MNDMPQETESQLIDRFIDLRDQRSNADKVFAEFRKVEFDEPMEDLERQLIQALQQRGLQNMSSAQGTAALRRSSSVTTADSAAFRHYVIDNKLWELADWRPNKTQVDDLVKAGEPLPPGINRTVFLKIHVLKKR